MANEMTMKDVRQATPQVKVQQVTATALMVALAERAQPTELRQGFIDLCEERHNHFHAGASKQAGESWLACGNQVCVQAREMLARAGRAEVLLTPLSFAAYKYHGLKFDGLGTGVLIKLVKPKDMPTEAAPSVIQAPPRVVLAD